MNTMSKTISRWFVISVFSAFVGTSQAYWYHPDLADALAGVTTVDGAVEIISEALKRDRFKIELVVNHRAAAASVGLELPPTSVIFARPPKRLERALLRRSETIGIDLPVKILVFEERMNPGEKEDSVPKIQFLINQKGYLVDRHDLNINNYNLWRLNRTVEKFADPDNGLVTVLGNLDFDDTITAIVTALEGTGVFRIPLILDLFTGSHETRATLIVFGNPNAGTPLMQATQEVAIDLPQKFLIREDRHNNVSITYNDPFFIAKRHNVQGEDARLTAISNALANFAEAGAGTGE